MAEQDLCEGRSSVAVHHCIRQLSYCRRDIRDSAGVWGEVSPMTITHTENIDALSTFEETKVRAYQEVVNRSGSELRLIRV